MQNLVLKREGREVIINENAEKIIRLFSSIPLDLSTGYDISAVQQYVNSEEMILLNQMGALVEGNRTVFFNPVFFYAWAKFQNEINKHPMTADERLRDVIINTSSPIVYSEGLGLFKEQGAVSETFLQEVNFAYRNVHHDELMSTPEIDSVMLEMSQALEKEIESRGISFELK